MDEHKEFRETFQKAYDYLFDRIGRRDNIWCYGAPIINANKNNKLQSFKNERLWVLDVPDKHIIAIDSDIWDFALNNWYYLKDEVYDALYGHVDEKDEDRIDEALASIYDKDPRKSYKDLIKPLKKANQFHDQFLIPSPIKKSWVVRTFVVNAEERICGGKKRK
jgi:hypothetical protein